MYTTIMLLTFLSVKPASYTAAFVSSLFFRRFCVVSATHILQNKVCKKQGWRITCMSIVCVTDC